ncbi:MAG: chain length determinant protein EpsF [Rhodocyclaceae bacterium]|nr:chain length determinant protein EpsF [Rhodocyclaceae bacterium]
MSWQQLLLILIARRRLAGTVALAVLALVALASFLMPKVYVATTSVVLDVKSPDPIAGVVLPGLMAPGYMATQVEIIGSDRVARQVIARLKLDADAQLKAHWENATGGAIAFETWLTERLSGKLDVKPSRDSNVVYIAYSDSDAERAANYANAFAAAYMDVNLELKVGPARQYAEWFDTQLATYRERLEAAQNALSAYQQKTGVIAGDERVDFETGKLVDLSAQLTLAQAQGAEARGKEKSGAALQLAEVLQNPLIMELKADIARREAKLDDAGQNFGANHPLYRQQVSELAALKNRLATETGRLAGSVAAAGQVTRQKESELLAAVEAQKRKLLELKRQRDAIAVLQRDVESAQRAYEAVAQRATQTRLEAQSVQTNVAVLTAAAAPYRPARPRRLVNLVLGGILGAFLGIVAALAAELFDRRVRGQEDMLALAGIPLLASIPPAAPPAWLPCLPWRRAALES